MSLLFSFGILAVAGILAIGANATNLMATTEYADFSIRGKSELTFNPNGSKNRDKFIHVKDYMKYSYGVMESFNLIPRLLGFNNEAVGKDSNMYEFMIGQGSS
jgi:hypothetical protein